MHGPLRSLLATTCLSLSLLPACDSQSDAPEATVLEARVAVGAVDGSEIVLGALIDGDALTIYECGRGDTLDTHTAWFSGTIGDGDDPDGFELTSGDLVLVGTRDADGLGGELVEADGTRRTFRLDAVADDGPEGIYIATEGDYDVGVVVQDNGQELTGQGAACDGLRRCTQVIILAPIATTTADSIVVEFDADSVDIETQVVRTLVPPPGT